MTSYFLKTPLDILPFYSSAIAICVSLVGLSVSVLSYRRKSGILVRGAFTFTQGRACNDKYVSEVVLENLKDRAVTIFFIYLKVGRNNFLEIENLKEKPLVLRPFETYRQNFGPIEFYSANLFRVELNHLLSDKGIRRQLILSTSEGRYNVPSRIKRWSPLEIYFANYLTGIIEPIRTLHNGRSIGGNIIYIVELFRDGRVEETVSLERSDFEGTVFKQFHLTKEALASKDSLEMFLRSEVQNGRLTCETFVVHDVDAWRRRNFGAYSRDTVRAEQCGPFHYHILGRASALYQMWKAKKHTAESHEGTRSSSTTP